MNMTASDAARQFLRCLAGPTTERDARRLELILLEFLATGYRAGLEVASATYGEMYVSDCQLEKLKACRCYRCRLAAKADEAVVER